MGQQGSAPGVNACVRTAATYPYGDEPPNRCRGAVVRQRLGAALALSALLHLWLAAGLQVEVPLRGARPPAVGPIVVRLEVRADVDEATRAVEPRHAETPPLARRRSRAAPAPVRESAPQPDTAVSETHPARTSGAARALPNVPDPTYYSARELDAYPRPLAPLGFDHPERAGRGRVGGRLLLQLLIDELGAVKDVSVVEAEPAGYFDEAARSVLAAARFVPGMKDGRAVKSRLLLSVSFAAAGGGKAVTGDQ